MQQTLNDAGIEGGERREKSKFSKTLTADEDEMLTTGEFGLRIYGGRPHCGEVGFAAACDVSNPYGCWFCSTFDSVPC